MDKISKKIDLYWLVVFGLIIFGSILIFVIYHIFNNNVSNYKVNYLDDLINRFKNGDTVIVYISGDDEKDAVGTNYVIDYLKDVYQLPIEIFDIKELENEGYQKFENGFDLVDKVPEFSLVVGKNQISSYVMGMNNETVILNILKQNQIIDDTLMKHDVVIENNPKQYFEKKENVLIYYSNVFDIKNYYENRKYLAGKAKQNDFTIYSSRNGMNECLDFYKFLVDNIKDVGMYTLFIVNDNKIVDYIQDFEEKDVDKFLKKNGYIK